MSYAIAPTFEGNNLGVRPLRTLSGMGAVADTAQVLIDNGWDSTMIYGLVQAGASDAQLTDLLNGATDPTAILSQLKANQNSGINPTVAPAPPVSPQSGHVTSTASGTQPSTAQSPSGSRLIYTVTYSQNVSTPAPDGLISQLGTTLGTYGMSVVSSNIVSNTYLGFGSSTVQFTIADNVGHQFLSDAQSVLDSLAKKITYNSVTGSQISMIAVGGSSVNPTPPPGPQTMTQWFEQNAPVIGLGFAALAIFGIVMGGRR